MDRDDNLSRIEMEQRRLAAARELLAGARQADLARKYGVSRTTAHRWCRALQESGVQSLRRSRATGRPSYLSQTQWQKIQEIYAGGPRAYAYEDDEWTTSRLSAVIEAEFGVRYQRDYIRRLRQKLQRETDKRFAVRQAVA